VEAVGRVAEVDDHVALGVQDGLDLPLHKGELVAPEHAALAPLLFLALRDDLDVRHRLCRAKARRDQGFLALAAANDPN
jgi:hypothetical protein